MQIDLEDVAAGSVFRSDICIVGAGVAGLLLATRLARMGFSVNLIEGGGLSLETRSQDLFNVPMAGRSYVGATEARFRVFGGSSTRWGGQMLPLPDEVFEPRDSVDGAGWPISRADIEGFYEEIQSVMGVNDRPFTGELLDILGHAPPLLSEDIRLRFSKWAPFSRRNLARTLGRECLAASAINVFLHGNVVSVDLRPSADHAKSVTVRNYGGAVFFFEADDFVICAGTIETNRLLLASNSVCPDGIGNTHDNLGRYFHDHLSVPIASLWGSARKAVLDRFAPYFVGGTLHTPKIEASPELQRRHGLLAVMAHIVLKEPEDSGLGVARQLLHSFQRREWPVSPGRLMMALPRGVKDLAGAWWWKQLRHRRFISRRARVQLTIDTEQRAQAASRIRLDEHIDAVGMRKAIVDWQVSSAESRTVAVFAGELERIFVAAGVRGIAWPRDLESGLNGAFGKCHDTYHSMGGTRFGISPRTSVVNPDLQIHGVGNLFVASCSLFPSGGSSNPTFTLMALTLRLAQHLRRRRAAGVCSISTGH